MHEIKTVEKKSLSMENDNSSSQKTTTTATATDDNVTLITSDVSGDVD